MKRFLAVLLSLLICLGTIGFQADAALGNISSAKEEYLVQFDIPGVENLSKASIMAKEKSILNSINVQKKDILETYDLLPVYCLKLDEKQVEALKKDSNIKNVEPNIEFKASAQTIPWGISRVQATDAHRYNYTGKGVKVAVLDSGIDIRHNDLNVRGGYSVFNDSPYSDGNGHGTHVAGTIAALDNSIGVKGVAYNVDLYAVKVLNSYGSGSLSGIAKGIEWSIKNNMDILNMSLGTSTHSSILKDWCDLAYDSGLLVVAAAGNSGNAAGIGDTVDYPARYSSVVAVAATDSSNKRGSFSAHGPDIEISAPGVDVYSTYPSNRYTTMSGTSMACPHVVGSAALVWGANPKLSNVQVRESLVRTARGLGNTNHYGSGLVQALDAINYYR
ncbi:MAG TPA: S8 family peptidase [Tissierellia bacterium]|nr:S8 family peptidase [Tissierellia bacterium]